MSKVVIQVSKREQEVMVGTLELLSKLYIVGLGKGVAFSFNVKTTKFLDKFRVLVESGDKLLVDRSVIKTLDQVHIFLVCFYEFIYFSNLGSIKTINSWATQLENLIIKASDVLE